MSLLTKKKYNSLWWKILWLMVILQFIFSFAASMPELDASSRQTASMLQAAPFWAFIGLWIYYKMKRNKDEKTLKRIKKKKLLAEKQALEIEQHKRDSYNART